MSDALQVNVPDIGDFEGVEIIEVLVKAGDTVQAEDPLISLESDKATMEVPCPQAGTISEVKVKEGDKVSEGDLILLLQPAADGADAAGEEQEEQKASPVTAEDAAAEAQAPAPAAAVAQPRPESSQQAPEEVSSGVPDDVDDRCEVLVLGSGPGGYSAAFRAADLGKKVALVEYYATLGGVCLNVGCIPSKALLHAAHVIEAAAFLSEHGVEFREPTIKPEPLRKWKDSVVGKLTGGVRGLAKQRKVTVIRGRGRFTGTNTLTVEGPDGGTRTIGFESAIIATGSRVATLPFIPEDPRVMDSTAALEVEQIPGKLLVLGGGIIGLEMANVYCALGSEVDVVEMLPTLLGEADRDIVKPLEKRMRERCANIWLKTRVTEVKATKKGLTARFEGEGAPESKTYDRVLVAVGRKPNSENIGLDALGVEVAGNGFIPVDRQMRTNVAHIFAIGDVARQPLLAHKAVHEGKVAAEVAAGEKSAFDARCIPAVVYTDPEVAWTGMTETVAKKQGIEYEKGSFPWAANGRSLGMGYQDGITKILFDKETGRAIGGAAVGPNAGDLISEVGLAIEMGADAHDIGLTIHPHPTLSETVGMAAEAVAGTLTDLYIKKR